MAKSNLSKERLEKLIEEATVDCYGDHECRSGLHTMIAYNLEFPFPAKVIGEEVTVVGVSGEGSSHLQAVCEKGGREYKVSILNMEFDPNEVKGFEWIEAYREWSRRG